MGSVPFRHDRGLTARMALAVFFLFLLSLPWLVLVGLVVWRASSLGVSTLVFICTLALILLLPRISEWAALAATGAPIADDDGAPQIDPILERLCALADVPKPRLAVIRSDVPQAFTIGGSKARATIVVSEGMIKRLTPQELEAVVAHELAHVINKDAFVMTVVSLPAIVIGWPIRWLVTLPELLDNAVARLVTWVLLFTILQVLFLAWIPWALACLLVLTISRYREYLADQGAALMTGSPEQLMSALVKISETLTKIPNHDLRRVSSMNAFMIVPATNSSGLSLDPLRIFPTHPTLDERLANLERIARDYSGLPWQGRRDRRVARAGRPRNRLAKLVALGGITFVTLLMLGRDPFAGSALLLAIPACGLALAFHALGRAQAGAAGFWYAAFGLGLFLVPWLVAVAGALTFLFVFLLGLAPPAG